MTEEQKQAAADAKIKLESMAAEDMREFGMTLAETDIALGALYMVTPQARESVQNGTCDESDEGDEVRV